MAPAPPKRQRTATDLKGGHDFEALSTMFLDLLSKRFAEQAEHISVSIQSAENHIMEGLMGLLTDQVENLAGVVDQLHQRVAQLKEQLSRRGDQLEGDVEGVPALMVKIDQLEAKLQLTSHRPLN
ncbi:uncharacterized protein [Drosophila takahashii]|uniref:uncharacterized protein n=1 Tax=Drosophila takahashii TaxID=29030 RepID=UPI0038993785